MAPALKVTSETRLYVAKAVLFLKRNHLRTRDELDLIELGCRDFGETFRGIIYEVSDCVLCDLARILSCYFVRLDSVTNGKI